jgi:hypothetical protein
MVEDKANKMRETLRLMSLSRVAYGGSYFCVQAGFAHINGIVIGGVLFGNEGIWTADSIGGKQWQSIQYMMACILMCLGYIGFTMSLSTLFTDPKVG